VSQNPSNANHPCGRCFKKGASEAAYSACRKLTTNVVSTIRLGAAPFATKPVAINCAEPAKTKADMRLAPVAEMPLLIASAPKMMPNGVAPITKGIVARTPAQNSDRRDTKGGGLSPGRASSAVIFGIANYPTPQYAAL
jgi:hypothetical protein